jgi:hypothetical protein
MSVYCEKHTCSLLGLHKTGSPINANDETSSNFGIESARVPSLVYFENTTDPSNDLMGRGIRGLIEVNDSVADIVVNVSLEGRGSSRNRSVMTSAHIQFVIVL